MTIVADDDVLHGQPRVEGTRIGVIHVYDMVVAGAEPAEVRPPADRDDPRLGTAPAGRSRRRSGSPRPPAATGLNATRK